MTTRRVLTRKRVLSVLILLDSDSNAFYNSIEDSDKINDLI